MGGPVTKIDSKDVASLLRDDGNWDVPDPAQLAIRAGATPAGEAAYNGGEYRNLNPFLGIVDTKNS